MFRILFTVLAVVTAILAVVLEQPSLYIAAAVLLLLALVALVVGLRGRAAADEGEPLPPHSAEKGDDLASLGILEIRPREKAGSGARPPEAPREPARRAVPPSAEPAAEGPPLAEAGEAPPPEPPARPSRPPEPPRATPPEGDGLDRNVIGPMLQSLLSAVEAHTVCLLRQTEIAPRYSIEAIASQNAYARSYGRFAAKVPLVKANAAPGAVTLQSVGEHGLPPASLGYYREPLAVRQIALVPIPYHADSLSYYLLADTMEHDGLAAPRQHTLLVQYAGLLATMLKAHAPAAPEPRSRMDIIAEEMAHAREAAQPLAFALVGLNRAGEVEAEGQSAAAEVTLEAYLRRSAPERRVERFGDLLYGVFWEGPVAEVEAWALDLHNELARANGHLAGGVSIGVALLGDRHDSPEAFRNDALDALRGAYETGSCIIVES